MRGRCHRLREVRRRGDDPRGRHQALADDRHARASPSRRSTAGSGSRRRRYARVFGDALRARCVARRARRRALRARLQGDRAVRQRPSRRSATSRCSRAARRSPRTRSPSRRPARTRRTSRPRATPSADGSSWMLNGRKHWIGNGHRAGVIATFAQAPVQRRGETVQRPTAFIIRPDMPGFRVVGTVRKLGIRGSTQAELSYEELRRAGRSRARHRRQGIRRRGARAERRTPDARRRLHRRHQAHARAR